MSPLEFVRRATLALQAEADVLARVNGSQRDRTLDEFRFTAGVVNGLLLASSRVETLYRDLQRDDED